MRTRTDPNLRILIDARLASHAGIGRYSSNLTRALLGCHTAPEITVLSTTDWRDEVRPENLHTSVIESPCDRYTLSELVQLNKLAICGRYDILHTTNYVSPIHTSIPVIVTIHDVMRLRLPEYCHSNAEFVRRFGVRRFVAVAIVGLVLARKIAPSRCNPEFYRSSPLTDRPGRGLRSSLKSRVFKFHHLYILSMMLNSVRLAQTVVTVSHFSRGEIIETFGLNPGKVKVIYPGIDAAFCEVDDPARIETAKTNYSLPCDFFLHVGLKRGHKNVPFLIKAYSRYASLQPDPASLVLVGPRDEDSEHLVDLVNETGISQNVLFRYDVPDRDLNLLYNSSIAVTVPSIYEGFGFPVAESMACGVPVIASNIPALREVSDGAALLVDPCDLEGWVHALREIDGNRDLRKSLRHEGKENARRFSWTEAASQAVELYSATRQDSNPG